MSQLSGRTLALCARAVFALVELGLAGHFSGAPRAAAATEQRHWAFQPIGSVALPETATDGWVRTPVDAFILARLREAGLRASPEADRRTLIRRLYLDVTGLPPTPAEVESFVMDADPEAYVKRVDAVLSSPRYGERWARHWLDVVRFAESHGFEMNRERQNAWSYRDWVIQSLNEDKSYRDFVRQQLAGDAVGQDAATGFLVAGAWDEVKSPDVQLTMQQRMDELHDIVNTTSMTFLGLTVGCARCHDHKFDPITQTDYYALQAVFAGVQHGERPLPQRDQAERAEAAERVRVRLGEIRRDLDSFEPLARAGAGRGRGPVNAMRNVDRFPAAGARWVRFTIFSTTDAEPCLDELEVFTAEAPRNIALAQLGTKASASGTYAGNARHKLEHVQDGRYGNDRSWISSESGCGWLELEFPEVQVIDRVVWGRDREGRFRDRLPLKYTVELATERGAWRTVASADDLCFIHSMTAQSNTHGPAENQMSTGFTLDGFPSVGAWVSYALGSEAEALPAFVAIPDPRGVPQTGPNNWASGFLPAVFQGTAFNAQKPIAHLQPARPAAPGTERAARDFLRFLNDRHLAENPGDAELMARIASYELAAKMQLAAMEASDLAGESPHLRAAYGVDDPNRIKSAFANNCILARRLLERGVRFVQLFNGAYAMGEGVGNWDGHKTLQQQYDVHGPILDQPCAALLQDLKARGLWEETLIAWVTEFGRMPTFQKGAEGRDHNPRGFTVWLAGAGVRSGFSYGLTDEFGYRAVENVCTIYDLHATILHLLGLDHEQLSYYHNGIERRLTDVHGRVITDVLT